jgi:hypothetical protein
MGGFQAGLMVSNGRRSNGVVVEVTVMETVEMV